MSFLSKCLALLLTGLSLLAGVLFYRHDSLFRVLSIETLQLHVFNALRYEALGSLLFDRLTVVTHFQVPEPILIRQTFTIQTSNLSTRYFTFLPLTRNHNDPAAPNFSIDVFFNDIPLKTLSSEEIPPDTSLAPLPIAIEIPADLVVLGENHLTLFSSETNWGDYYSLYSTNHKTEGVESCLSRPIEPLEWTCDNVAPGSHQNGRGFTYNISLIGLPSENNVDSEFSFLLDSTHFPLNGLLKNYLRFGYTPYHLDPTDTDQLRKIAAIPIPGETDGEKAVHIMNFVHLALNYPRQSNSDNLAYDILVNGGAWCSGNAYVFTALAALHRIDSRVVFLTHSEQDQAGHVVAEAWIDDQWVVFDPMLNLVLRQGDNWYSVSEIAENSEVISQTPLADFEGLSELFYLKNTPDFSPKSHLLDDTTLTAYENQTPLRWLDFFNDQAVIRAGGIEIPYYESHFPPLDETDMVLP